MSKRYPIIAITGSSGAGTTTVKCALENIFQRIGATAAFVEGDSFHRYDRKEMKRQLKLAKKEGRNLSHFGPEGNHFDRQYELFKSYGERGEGMFRHYIHSEEESIQYGQKPGSFTEWESLPVGTDLLFYEGLHGGVVTDEVNMIDEVELLIGVAPSINLEWIQKVDRDTRERGYEHEDVVNTIYRRMYDYMHYILPQFDHTHINFQRVPMVDTSNPLTGKAIPTADQSVVIIHFVKDRPSVEYKLQLKELIEGASLSAFDNIVIPGGKMMYAMELILTEKILTLMRCRDELVECE
ncbi:MAG: phosphoribulokinase [Gammaproteobacteria bacterium]|nr:phosphoribulokinase [Gammaproteobacteria bacterium]